MTRLTDLLHLLRSRRWVTVTIGAVLMTLYLLVTIVTPRMQDVVRSVTEWNRHVARYDDTQHLPTRLQTIRTRHQQHRDALDSLYVHVPRGDRISVILRTLQETATASGVTLTAVRPGEATQHDTYEKLPLDVVVEGTFHPVARFVSRIERNAYLIVVDDLRLRRTSDTSRDLNATLRLGLMTLRSDAPSSGGS